MLTFAHLLVLFSSQKKCSNRIMKCNFPVFFVNYDRPTNGLALRPTNQQRKGTRVDGEVRLSLIIYVHYVYFLFQMFNYANPFQSSFLPISVDLQIFNWGLIRFSSTAITSSIFHLNTLMRMPIQCLLFANMKEELDYLFWTTLERSAESNAARYLGWKDFQTVKWPNSRHFFPDH